MAMLYPPYIEGKLPAQVGDTLRIPYQLNRTAGPNDLQGKKIYAKIRTVATNSLVGVFETEFVNNAENEIYYALYPLSSSSLRLNQHYKIQLAFGDGSPGPYSTMGVFYYISQPKIELNQQGFNWTGKYDSQGSTDFVEEYKFEVYNEKGLVYTTNWQLNKLTNKNSPRTFNFETEMGFYWVVYSVKTFNGYEGSSNRIFARPITGPLIELPVEGFAKVREEDGAIAVGFKAKEDCLLKGDFRIKRRCNNEPWEQMGKIRFNIFYSRGKEIILFEDFTVQQGKIYEYAVEQYDSDLFSDRFFLGKAKVDFDDCYLFDGERQLKIKFNPKISSFKTTLMESKLDTIGGKYPFFFKNGYTEYKEFPLSGLISFHMDDNGKFMTSFAQMAESGTLNNSGAIEGSSTDLTNEIFTLERDFKLEVLKWLNDGKPKLFRSASEGNYIVRLMNVSLAPEDRLGRMLHTFSATAYEIAPYNLEALKDYAFIKDSLKQLGSLNYKIITATDQNIPNAIKARVLSAPQGKLIRFIFQNEYETSVEIGNTGYYECFIEKDNPLTGITFDSEGPVIIEYIYEEEPEYPFAEDSGITSNTGTYKVDRIISQDMYITEMSGVRILYLRIQKKDIEYYPSEDLYPNESKRNNQTVIYTAGSISNSFEYSINGESFELSSGRIEFTYKDLDITSFSIGDGLYADIFYIDNGEAVLEQRYDEERKILYIRPVAENNSEQQSLEFGYSSSGNYNSIDGSLELEGV